MERFLTLFVTLVVAAVPAAATHALADSAAQPGASGSAPVNDAPNAPFPDVPPCHWAADSVAKVAAASIFQGFPPDPAYDSVNALRQVFEGWKCANAAWSLHFLTGAPDAFPAKDAPALASFTLEPTLESLHAGQATIAFRLSAVVDENGARRTLARRGAVTATQTDAGWRVAYADLASLDLPFFPH